MKVWIAGQHWGDLDGWSILGVFDSEEQAVAACDRDEDFVAPIPFNEKLQPERRWWPGCYYPKVESQEEAARRAADLTAAPGTVGGDPGCGHSSSA